MKLILTKYQQGIGLFEFEENTLVKANIYDTAQKICVGDVFLGRIQKVLPNIKAYFVQIDNGKEDIFLPFSECMETFKCGDKLPIQIKKEASKGKQPLGTTKISLSGLYCVVNLEAHAFHISSKLDEDIRKYWKDTLSSYTSSENECSGQKDILSKYCIIIRTNVSGAENKEDVLDECIKLSKQMDDIVSSSAYLKPGTKLFGNASRYLSDIKDIPHTDFEEIVTDDAKIYNELQNVFSTISNYAEKIRLYQDNFPLSKLYCIETKLQEALQKKVWLKCGGFLVIEPTEALTVIDVNSGKYEKKGDAEQYYKKVNEEAAIEIAKQLKLRNISGIIIVDFINMAVESNQKELLELLAQLVSKDTVKTYVIGMTSLGLVEMTRAKAEKPLREQINQNGIKTFN